MFENPAILGAAVGLGIALVCTILLFRALIVEVAALKRGQDQTTVALAKIAEFQGNLIDEMPEKHGERLVKVEKWIEGREALARHITAQTQHRRNEGGLQ